MKYEYWFANIQGISCKKKQYIRAKVRSAQELYYIEETELKKLEIEEDCCHKILQSVKQWKLEQEYEKLQKQQVHFLTIRDADYPQS